MFFNFYDMYLAFQVSIQGLYLEDHVKLGEGIGRMISDLFIKNPLNEEYRFTNSLVYPNGNAILMAEKPKLSA